MNKNFFILILFTNLAENKEMANEISAALKAIISNTWTTYFGVLIEKRGNQFYACRELHNSIEEAKAAIDKSFEQLAKTIK